MRLWPLLAAPLLTSVAAAAATPEATGTAIIGSFDDTLTSVMQNAKALGYDGRYQQLAPVIDRTFDVPFMTRSVVGSTWSTWSADKQMQVTAAFRRFIIATYARRFDGYTGEKFEIDGARVAISGLLVNTKIVRPNDTPIALNYLMRPGDAGQYRVVDIFLTGTISELATRRSEFGDVLRHDGYDGLIAALARKSDASSTD